MAKVKVEAELPEGWELAEPLARPARHGDPYLTRYGVQEWCDLEESQAHCIILRKAFEWPDWLHCDYILKLQSGEWRCGYFESQEKPKVNHYESGWSNNGATYPLTHRNHRPFDIDFPDCDWKDSYRENPKNST